jgi:molybdopterin synthase sulfur carrier subunit
MPIVHIPSLMQDLTHGETSVEVSGRTVRVVIEALDARYPGIRDRLCTGTGDADALAPTLAVAVDGRLSRLGLFQPLTDASEIRFLPAIEGG